MFNITRKAIDWCGKKLTLETGKLARQADGAVFVTYGETMLLCTVVANRKVTSGIDFLPLTVVYQEKSFSAGRIPGGFFKREGRPSEKEVLTSRLIDRSIRPSFPDDFHNEVQVICTLLSHDLEHDPDVVALVGASAAIAISGVPTKDIVAGVRIGLSDDNWLHNPSYKETASSKLDLIISGSSDYVFMVESQADELSEETMLEAVIEGQKNIKGLVDFIKEFACEVGAKSWYIAEEKEGTDLVKQLADIAEEKLKAAFAIKNKQERSMLLKKIEQEVAAKLTDEGYDAAAISSKFKALQKRLVRRQIIEKGTRIDGRAVDVVRDIRTEVGILHRTHGSALFTRGETQALVAVTLGTAQDEQIIDSLEAPESRERFMLHYNFPPYSVNETSQLKAPGRREIGHGKLAWRALQAVFPSKNAFSYTIRVVSEITESNGSSSMATVCSTSMALMDAGVPIKKPVSGIAMGLIKEEDGVVVLSDILGDEDYLGDMDFKVAGTVDGITALQMDIKIGGITAEIMKKALAQANKGRLSILQEMALSITCARQSLNRHAPVISSINIPKDKIREIIGTGGKVIREICEVSGAKIDIEDSGKVNIAAVSKESGDKAMRMIANIVCEPEVGEIYEGKVVKVVDFGAFVNFMGSRDGLVHISELSDGRINKVEDIVREGDIVKVKLLAIDNRGKMKLSMRAVETIS